MLDGKALKQALLQIYGVEEQYIVPLDQGWYVPTFDKNNKKGTWIGYRILDIKPLVRAYYSEGKYVKSVKIRFRLSFVGLQAEELALQTLMFDDRSDVIKAFEDCQTQLNYNTREILTYPVREGGLNDNLCWFTDFDAQSFYETTVKWGEWEHGDTPEDKPWVYNIPAHKSDRLESGSLIVRRNSDGSE